MDAQQDREWSDLSAIWRQKPDGALDVARVRKLIRTRVRNANLLFLFDVGGSCAAFVVAYLLIGRWVWPSNLVGITFLLYGMFTLSLGCWSRFAARETDTRTLSQAFDADVQQARARIRWAQSGYMVCAATVIVLPILYYAHSQPSYESLVPLPFWIKVAILGPYTAGMFWRCRRMLRENRKYLNGLLTIKDELFPGEDAESLARR